jgi:hypothetical protein
MSGAARTATLGKGGAVLISVPLPPKECHPNARSGWRAKARGMAQTRRDARYAAFDAWGSCDGLPRWQRAHVVLRAFYPDHRRRDNDGLLASCKGYLDGIVDSGLIADDSGLAYTILPSVVDRERVGVTIEIRAVDEMTPVRGHDGGEE